MFCRARVSGPDTCLRIVENHRDGKKVRQRVIATPGRLDHLQETGALERLVPSACRFSGQIMVLAGDGEDGVEVRHIGPALVFEELWQSSGCQGIVHALVAGRHFRFDVARAIFASVLHRIMVTGSDRAACGWMRDLVFFDTTSLSFTGRGGRTIGRQMVPGLVLTQDGRPVCSEMGPGNVADVTALEAVARRLRHRFGIRSVCLVADRGMIGKGTMAALEARGRQCIPGARPRAGKEVREEVPSDGGTMTAFTVARTHDPEPLTLEIREVVLPGADREEPGGDGRQSGGQAEGRGQGADRQPRLPAPSQDRGLPDRPRQGARGGETRRHPGAAHQHRPSDARGGAALRRSPAADHHATHRRQACKREENPRTGLTIDIGSRASRILRNVVPRARKSPPTH